MKPPQQDRLAATADWFGLNRATLAVLAVIGFLGLSEELWSNFLSLHLKDQAAAKEASTAVLTAVKYMGLIAFGKNLLEGFAYIIGGRIAHRLGARTALAVSAVPMAIGFFIMWLSREPWAIAIGALLMTNWEPLSVPATFDVVGSEVRKERRTIAFAVQSIQKRVPKMIGPAIGGLALGAVGYWLNLSLAIGCLALAVILQLALMKRLTPKPDPDPVPLREIMRTMPKGLKQLLGAEIFIRWGDWFARDFAVLYVVSLLVDRWGWNEAAAIKTAGFLLTVMATTALATYVPMAKWIDRSASPKPFIGLTFLLFSLFPICLVLLPKLCGLLGVPVIAGLVVTFVLNGLRELGEPARKALISSGFDKNIRARAIGLYWGLRAFAFCPAPLVAAYLWTTIGPDFTFLIGGAIGLAGTAWFAFGQRPSAA
ncbi:MAG: MFS transporter [Vicinamibacterales bacterium]